MTRRLPRCSQPGRGASRQPRWLVAAALLLAVVLPVQGIALSLQQAWRPAHVHVHSAACGHGADSRTHASATRIEMDAGADGGDQRPALIAALADDAVIDVLPASGAAHQHDADGNDIPADATAATDAHAAHDGIGHHLHAPGDPDVVYIDEGRDPEKAAAGVSKVLSDGMVMLAPTWPASLSARRGVGELPELQPAYATRLPAPLDRPPA